MKYACLFASMLVLVALMSCGGPKYKSPDEQYAIESDTEYADERVFGTDDSENEARTSSDDTPARRYQNKYDEVYTADCHLMRADGRKLWYNYYEEATGYSNKLYVYDSLTDEVQTISLNRTQQDDDAMHVEDMVERGGVITIIMSEMRNSNGWLEGTYVWQYNCDNGSWNALARACSGAKFVNDRKSVKINWAECLNPEDPTYLQEYKNNSEIIKL